MRRVIITNLIILTLILLGTVVAIYYARGYRPNGINKIEGTGILSVTSKPDGAKVYINDHLTTATNSILNLPPGEYTVKIAEDGYIPWQKKISIQKEIVTRVEVVLFPVAPKLEAVTLTGADNPVIDTTGTLVAFTVSSASAEKNGIYVLDMGSRNILNFGGITQIADESIGAISKAKLAFSPDSTQLIATIPGINSDSTYLLPTHSFNDNPPDITATLFTLQNSWEREAAEKLQKRIGSYPKSLRNLITTTFKNPIFTEDGNKILYEASSSATIPLLITPRVIGSNSTPETRSVKEDHYYVYDVKEDRNYLIYKKTEEDNDFPPKFMWHPLGQNIIYVKNKSINIMDYDALNQTTLYSGPFVDHYVYAWPDGSRILILTSLNPAASPYNLYTISLR